MKTEFDLLKSDRFRARPAMWLGKKSISSLRIFLDGFWTYQYLNGVETDSNLPFWLFQPYVQNYYKSTPYDNKGYSWNGLILLQCGENESEALDKFFELFDEFQNIKIITASIAIIKTSEINFFQTQNSIHRRYYIEHNEVDYGPAERIYIIEYSNNFGCVLYRRFHNLEVDSDFFTSTREAKQRIRMEYGDNTTWASSEVAVALSDLYVKASAD